MKKIVVGILICLLMVTFSLGMVGCGNEEEVEGKYIDFSYTSENYISQTLNRIAFPFLYNKRINKAEITDIVTDKDIEVEVWFCEEDSEPLRKDGYYYYGFIIEVKNPQSFVLNSFTLTIDDEFTREIDINLNVVYYEMTDPSDKSVLLYPLSEVLIVNLNENLYWTFASKKDITIKNIEFIAAEVGVKNVLVGEKTFNSEDGFRLKKDTSVAITVKPDYTKVLKKLCSGYLEITYVADDAKDVELKCRTSYVTLNGPDDVFNNMKGDY